MENRISVSDRMDRLPVSRYCLTVLIFVFIGWFSESIDIGGTGFLLPTIREAFGMDTAMGGYYSSICFVGMFVGAILAGSISDRVGRKKVIVVSMITWGIAGFAMAFAPNIVVLFVLRFFLGVGLGAQFPVAVTYLSESVPAKKRSQYMTMYQMFCPLGIAFAGVLTMLILPHFSWQGVFIAEALPSLFVIGIIKFCPESCLWLESKGRFEEADAICDVWEEHAIKHLHPHELPPVEVHEHKEVVKGSFKDLFSKKYIGVVILAFFFQFFSMASDYGLTTWLTTLLVGKGFSVVNSTFTVTLGIFGGLLAMPFTTWASNKFGRKKTFLLAGILTCGFGIIYGLSATFVTLVIFGICYQFAKYVNAMMCALYTPELFDTYIRGAGTGFASSGGRFGSIVGPIVLAGIITSFGGTATFIVAACCAILPGLSVFIFGPETLGKKL